MGLTFGIMEKGREEKEERRADGRVYVNYANS